MTTVAEHSLIHEETSASPRSDRLGKTAGTCKTEVALVTASELVGELEARWEAIRGLHQHYQTPYFDANFTRAVARVRDDVRIAVVTQSDQIVAFLPFQMNRGNKAIPAGGRLNDYHGLLGTPEDPIAAYRVICKTAGLSSYKYHAAVAECGGELDRFHFRKLSTHHIDLAEGWDHYRRWVRRHSSTVKRQGQKTRNLEREVGPIRFEFDCQDGNVLERLIELKRAKYQRTKTFDILSVNWAADLLREIQTIQTPNFQGQLQAMWAGDELVCVHFGMLAGDILHYWFPIYDPRFSRYSPGTEMMLRVAQEADQRGLKKVDLGYGDDEYKFKFCNGSDSVVTGMIDFNPARWQVAKTRYNVRTQLKSIPMKPLAKRVLRRICPEFGKWNFR